MLLNKMQLIIDTEQIIENVEIKKNWLEKFIERGQYHVPQSNCESIFVKAGKYLIISFAACSYDILLTVGSCGIVLYMCGWKKAIKLAPISVGAYALIQAIASAL